MNTKLLLLATTSLLLLAPVANLHLFGLEMTPMNQEKVMSDSDITAAVKKAIVSDKDLSKFNINVVSDKGIVTLSGKVDTFKAKLDIENKAQNVVGVLRVINNIEVKS